MKKTHNAMVVLTDYEWFDTLRKDNASQANFWTPTPWNIKSLNVGGDVYFLLKKKYGRKICGHGKFVEYKELILTEAWNNYGKENGTRDFEQLKAKIKDYTTRNSQQNFNDKEHTIGCIILEELTLLEDSHHYYPSTRNWQIPNPVVKFKYL